MLDHLPIELLVQIVRSSSIECLIVCKPWAKLFADQPSVYSSALVVSSGGWEQALCRAVRGNAIAVAERLLADATAIRPSARQLILARSVEMTSLLLAAGADVNAADADGLKPLYAAVLGGKDPEVLLLLMGAPGADVDDVDGNGNNAWATALLEEKEAIALRLLRDLPDADVDRPDPTGFTPLIWASMTGSKEAASLLLRRGAAVNHRETDFGNACLHLALSGDCREIGDRLGVVDLLLSAPGVDVNLGNHQGFTPLHVAVCEGCPQEVIRRLLRAPGIEVDRPCESGQTPLMASILSADIVELLLAHGADPNLRNQTGSTALAFALEHDRADAFRVLLPCTAEADKGDLLLRAADLGRLEIARVLLNAVGFALHGAARNGRLEVVKAFVEDAELEDEEGHDTAAYK